MGVKCSGATFNMTLPVLGIQLLLTMLRNVKTKNNYSYKLFVK